MSEAHAAGPYQGAAQGDNPSQQAEWSIDRTPAAGAPAQKPQFRSGDEVDRSNLIVNYLPSDLGDDQLRDLFTEFGAIESARVIKERGSGKSLGYGFIKYQYPEDAEKAVLSRNGYALGGKRIKVSVARPASDDIKNCKLYVANLPQHYEKAEVVGMFCPFGRIIECRLLTDPSTGKSRNIAFVQYDSKQEATAALSLNGTMLEGSARPLVVKHAEDQQQRRERLHSKGPDDSSYGPIRSQPRPGGPRSTSYDPVSGQMQPYAAPPQATAPAPQPQVNQYIGLLAALAQTPGLGQLSSLIPALAAAASNPQQLASLLPPQQGAPAPAPLAPPMQQAQQYSYAPPPTSYAPPPTTYAPPPASYAPPTQYNPPQAADPYAYLRAPAPAPAPAPSYGGSAPSYGGYAPPPPTSYAPPGRDPLNREGGEEGVVLYVGNLPQTSDASVLQQLIAPHAPVLHAKVITNKGTSICKGYGFVSVPDNDAAHRVIAALNNFHLGDRTLKVMFRERKSS